jgi:outer membrane lipoprotein-sorting protein
MILTQKWVAVALVFAASVSYGQAPAPESLLNGLKAKWGTIQDYQTKMRSRNRLGGQTDEKKIAFSFKKPHQVRTEVMEGDKKGSVLTRDAAGAIRGKKGGVLGIVAITLKDDDERVSNLRGRKFYLGDWGSVIKEFFEAANKGWKLSALPDEKFNETDCYVLQAERNDSKSSVTRDVIWIDKANSLILCRKQYEGQTLVNEVVWWDIHLNVGLDDSLFTL